jgi:hypothetical protein
MGKSHLRYNKPVYSRQAHKSYLTYKCQSGIALGDKRVCSGREQLGQDTRQTGRK